MFLYIYIFLFSTINNLNSCVFFNFNVSFIRKAQLCYKVLPFSPAILNKCDIESLKASPGRECYFL